MISTLLSMERTVSRLIAPSLNGLKNSSMAAPQCLRDVGVGDVLVITLERSNRWPIVSKRLQNAGFAADSFRRIEGIDGKNVLDNQTMAQIATPRQQWMSRHIHYGAGQWGVGAAGCSLAHHAACVHLSNNKKSIDAILVFEDDALPACNDLPEKIAALVNEAGGTDKFDILRLDWWESRDFGTRIESFSPNLWQEKGLAYFYTCYVVTKRGARQLIANSLPLAEHCDNLSSFLAGTNPEFVSLLVKDRQAFVRQDRSIKSEIRSTDNGRVLSARDAKMISDTLAESDQAVGALQGALSQREAYLIAISVLATVAAMLLLFIIFIVVWWCCVAKKKKRNLDDEFEAGISPILSP